MGLDQYLFAGPPPAQDEGRPTELAYWRKANHVHRWITEHVGEVKNVEPLPITREQLCALREAAIAALNGEHVTDVMPGMEGFFFGPIDDEEWLRYQLEQTVEQLDNALVSEPDLQHFTYFCWW